MANSPLHSLTAATSAATTAEMYLVNSPFGSGDDRRITFDNLQLSLTKVGKITVTQPATSGTLTLADGSSLITSGANSITLTSSGATNVTLPTTGTLATLAGSEALTNKTYNGNTFTAGSGVLTISASKTLTVSNTITLAGTDGKGIDVGAATSGKILIGDGSNMILSTSTIPTSAGATAGKILVSDATNYVLSTPTFPNASATSGKVIKSDGTNWVASTETYAVPGTTGNVLTSDGTNWTSAAASGGGPSGMFDGTAATYSWKPQSTDITAAVAGSGSVTDATASMKINTGNTNASDALTEVEGATRMWRGVGYDDNIYVQFFDGLIDATANGTVIAYTMANGRADSVTKYVGWRLNASSGTDTILAVSKDGTTEQTTDITASFGNTTGSAVMRNTLCVLNANTNAKVYINGTLLATHSTNFPPASDTTSNFNGLTMRVLNANDGASTQIWTQTVTEQVIF